MKGPARRCAVLRASFPRSLALLILAAVTAEAQQWQDPFDSKDLSPYPQPQPQASVPRAGEIQVNASMKALPANAPAQVSAANGGVKIDLLGLVRSAEIAGVAAPEGMEAVTLVMRWENVHPRKDAVMDVAYLVPQAGQHLWLVAAGEAWGLRAESMLLPQGVDPLGPIGLARLGETRELRAAWFVPKGTADLQLRLFDYQGGHVLLAAAGDAQRAASLPAGQPVDSGAIPELQMSVLGMRYAETHAGQAAPQGWRYAMVQLRGLAVATQGGIGALVQFDPSRFAWLVGEGGVLRYALAPQDGARLVVFTPEVPRRQELAFLVPESETNFRLGIRGRSDVASLRASTQEPAALPATSASLTDPNVVTLGLAGLRHQGQALVVDLVATPLGGASGVEIDLAQQLALLAGSTRYKPDEALTRSLYRQPPTPFVLPPGTPVRFEVAFAVPQGTAPGQLEYQLEYRGASGSNALSLSGQSIDTSAVKLAGDALPVIAPPAAPPATPPVSSPGVVELGAPVAADKTTSADPSSAVAGPTSPAAMPAARPFVKSDQPAQLMPLTLPPFDAGQATAEVEPNDGAEQATALGAGLAAKGSLTGADSQDWYRFQVEGEPQLWTIEGKGPGLHEMGLIAAGGREIARSRKPVDPMASTRLDNLLLLPGRYWISASQREAPDHDYTLRAVPLGRPDRSAEFEPNDDVSQALPLEFGVARHGLVGRPDDIDRYRFELDRSVYLRLQLRPPPGLVTRLKIEGNGLSQRADPVPDDDTLLAWEALLTPGTYAVDVYADDAGKSSQTPYELRLDYLDPFNPAVDVEPNNSAASASAIGDHRQFRGALGPFDNSDYLRLPALTGASTLTITGQGGARFDIASLDGGTEVRLDIAEIVERRSGDSATYRAVLEAGKPYLLRVTGNTAYRFTLDFDPLATAAAAGPAVDASLELSAVGEPPRFAAYRAEAQQASMKFRVRNLGASARKVQLEALPAQRGWDLLPGQNDVPVPPGGSVEIDAVLHAAADRDALHQAPVFVRARAGAQASTPVMVTAQASCGVASLGATPEPPLPVQLLGGLNLAWNALGGQPAGADEAQARRIAVLFDGMSPLAQSLKVQPQVDAAPIEVRLAGSAAAKIAGITLVAGKSTNEFVDRARFTILASADGSSYSPVFEGILEPIADEQAFVFAQAALASHLRLQFHATDGVRDSGTARLAEWKVIAVPGSKPLGEWRPNLAAPALGGHVVWTSWRNENYDQALTMLSKAGENAYQHIEALQPLEWVIGFRDNRAARITTLQWRAVAADMGDYRHLERVTVAASTDGPTGPWVPLGDWKLPVDAGAEGEWVLPAPVWARFLRFTAPAADKPQYWRFAETLRVIEQAEDANYRSVLGEWGHYARHAQFEADTTVTAKAAIQAGAGGESRAQAVALASVKPRDGRVEVGIREDWFQLDVPADLDRIEFAFSGGGAGRLEPLLEDQAGQEVELEETEPRAGTRIFQAQVQPGARYFLRVAEARRTILIAWDNSSSVGPFHESMYRSITRLADDIRPGQEVLNLMPFADGTANLLLGDWSDDPLAIKRAIGEYDRKDGSSNAEFNLLGGLSALSLRPGNRGIVLLTDADSDGIRENPALWRSLTTVRPRVFAVELQIREDAGVEHFQDLMQDWAAVNDGHYTVFRSQADLDVAFDHAACMMRQPAEYAVAWSRAPGPGSLVVEWQAGKAMAGAAIELIFDASGSMISQKNMVGGRLKMDVAREVLLELVDLLPADSQVGLRLYGHRRRDGTPGACEDSELVVPVGALDRAQLQTRIKGVKALGGTPIAYSLREAGKDLAAISGPKLIVLLTDGKEECQGDPAGVVKELQAQGLDARIDIVGFALADAADKADMSRVAQAAGGRFHDAQNRESLAASIIDALAMPYEVLDSRGRIVASGLTGQQVVALNQGNYSVVVHTAKGEVTVRDVGIVEGGKKRIVLSREAESIHSRVE